MWRVAVGVHTCVSRSTFPRLVHSLPVARLFFFNKADSRHRARHQIVVCVVGGNGGDRERLEVLNSEH